MTIERQDDWLFFFCMNYLTFASTVIMVKLTLWMRREGKFIQEMEGQNNAQG